VEFRRIFKYTTMNKVNLQFIKLTKRRQIAQDSLLVLRLAALFTFCIQHFCSCKKLVQIEPPINSITTTEVFVDSANAASAVLGIYNNMINNGSITFGSGSISLYCGASSDELIPFRLNNTNYAQLYNDALLSNNSIIYNYFWASPYSYIYQANACIEGLQASTSLPSSVRTQLIGEAKFFRAFFYFYMINLFGDVPYVNTTAWAVTDHLARTPKAQIDSSIISDLKDAQTSLPNDYLQTSGQRIRATAMAATALLAREYLFTGDYLGAESQATTLLNNTGLYSLCTDPNTVFLANSTEAILQWQLNTSIGPYNATPEGDFNIPYDSNSRPSFYVNPNLLNAFEAGDLRWSDWLDSTDYNGSYYYYPYKYKIGAALEVPNAPATENYMVLRLAEQYLVRAEAEAQLNDLSDAINDLNVIRTRANLPNTTAITQADLLTAIAHERRIELFAEWGQRWLDLKRTVQADVVLPPLKGQWTNDAQLYPIPLSELQTDDAMKQNPGY
jgi:starch-binding outer membrane protein, SusD/RagB family